jgi:hypothetical protein
MRRLLRSSYDAAWSAWHAASVSGWRKDLERICAGSADVRATLLFAPSVAWQTLLAQRPQHMARAFARAACLVFYAVPYHARNCAPGFHEIGPRLYLAKVPPSVFAGRGDVTAIALAYNGDWARRARPARLVYEMIDDLRVFPQPLAQLARAHRALLAQADLVVASAAPLLDQTRAARPDTILVSNGVDVDYVRQHARRGIVPEGFADLVDAKRPIIGYHGALAAWVDYPLLAEVARMRPDYAFVLIGPDYDGSFGKSRLHRLNNVRWLGARSREDLMRYLAWYDAAMLPFVVGPVTDAVSPLKLFEYLAAGKPVVSTPLAEVSRYPVVLLADEARTFALALDHALEMREDRMYLGLMKKTADENTWEARAQDMLAAIEALASRAKKVERRA